METTQLIDPSFWVTKEPAAPGSSLPSGASDPEGLVWFRTSGTSGQPRWIGHSREGLLLSAAMVNWHLGVSEEDVWGLALPLHHVGGFGVVARAFEAGTRLEVFPGPWEPESFHAWLTGSRTSCVSLVPTQVHDLVKAGLRAPASLRCVVVGGGHLDASLGHSARDFGWPVLASFGMTEAASQIATQSTDLLGEPYRAGSLPILPHWELAVSDSRALRLKGPSLFVATLEASVDGWSFLRREGDWFTTRDRVELDGDRITMLGRLDRVVKVLGELVDLNAVEQEIGLEGVAIVAEEDPRQGVRLLAYSEVEEGEAAVESYNRQAAGPWRISECVKVDCLPRSELGKIRYAELV